MGKKRPDEKFGRYLRVILARKEKSAEWLGKRAGLPGGYIRQLKRGEVGNPSLLYALRIMDALRIPFDQFLREAGYLPPYDPEKLPAALKKALPLLSNPTPREIEHLAIYGPLDNLKPEQYPDLLEEYRDTPEGRVAKLMRSLPAEIKERCYVSVRAIVADMILNQEAAIEIDRRVYIGGEIGNRFMGYEGLAERISMLPSDDPLRPLIEEYLTLSKTKRKRLAKMLETYLLSLNRQRPVSGRRRKNSSKKKE